MSSTPAEIRLSLAPRGRFDTIDVRKRLADQGIDALDRHQRALYCSFHTTAGYLDRALAARLAHHEERFALFFKAFRAVFPQHGPYRHDQMELRAELSEDQKRVEPRNGDSHLTFIGAGMRNCVTYANAPAAPVYFIELDGVNKGAWRERTTSVVAYDKETVVERARLVVPVSRHPIDAVNLSEPRFGLMEAVNELLARSGIEKGRVDISLEATERNAGITVNEYETLLMQHDLAEVLKDPLRFARLKAHHLIEDPLAVPGKALSYARYDVVRILNSLMEAFRVHESVVERLVAKAMALPARRFLRTRRVSFLATDMTGEGRAQLVRGRYQSPILVQWGPAESQARALDVSLVRLS
jgi:thiamine phosphate synthase YjbQ (UPF0047 family)